LEFEAVISIRQLLEDLFLSSQVVFEILGLFHNLIEVFTLQQLSIVFIDERNTHGCRNNIPDLPAVEDDLLSVLPDPVHEIAEVVDQFLALQLLEERPKDGDLLLLR
jgi:hypothetical protein